MIVMHDLTRPLYFNATTYTATAGSPTTAHYNATACGALYRILKNG